MEFSVQREKVVETLTSGLVFPQLFLFTQSETTHVSISQLDYELKISIAHRNQEL